MSLRSFHIFFIAVCAALSLFMVLWGWNDYRTSSSGIGLGVGLVGIAGLLTLLPYSRWVQKKFRRIAPVLAFALACWTETPAAQACAVCFGDPSSSMVQGIKAGIWVLIAVIAGVLTGIAAIGISWARRAKALHQ